MLCAIWYHFYNLKNMKNTHGGMLLLVKHSSMGVFHVFKLNKQCQIAQNITFNNSLGLVQYSSTHPCTIPITSALFSFSHSKIIGIFEPLSNISNESIFYICAKFQAFRTLQRNFGWKWSIAITPQGPTIRVRRVRTYAYFYWRAHDFEHAYVDTYTHFLSMIFKSFFLIILCLKNLMLYI